MIALVFCGDLKYCPYIKRYEERLNAFQKDYKVYFWNRGNFKLDLPSYYEYYDEQSDLNASKAHKLIDFFKFKRWINKIIEKDQPQKMVLLSTLTGIIMADTIKKHKIEYIYDIRDYSYERIGAYYCVEKSLIRNSEFTTISSKGFKEFLPEHEYIIAHNFNRNDVRNEASFNKKSGTIHFVWNGVVRYFEYQKQYLDALGNDSRFYIEFFGDGPELNQYQKYCNEKGYNNITFYGAYDNAEKAKILENADILNNCYGYCKNPGNKLKYAVSNRFYDGIIYHIPQLVEPKGFKTEWTLDNKVGINLGVSTNFADELYNYYQTIDEVEFDAACDTLLEEVMSEDNQYVEMIDKFIR